MNFSPSSMWRAYQDWMRLPRAFFVVVCYLVVSFISFAIDRDSRVTDILMWLVIFLVLDVILISLLALRSSRTRARWYRW